MIKHFDFPDHYSFKQLDIDSISSKMESFNVKIIITTEKDMVKIANLRINQLKIYSISVSFNLADKNRKALLEIIQK